MSLAKQVNRAKNKMKFTTYRIFVTHAHPTHAQIAFHVLICHCDVAIRAVTRPSSVRACVHVCNAKKKPPLSVLLPAAGLGDHPSPSLRGLTSVEIDIFARFNSIVVVCAESSLSCDCSGVNASTEENRNRSVRHSVERTHVGVRVSVCVCD